MTEPLNNAIESVYAVFASVPKPKTIEGCRCCIDDKEVAALLTTPLREISPAELSSYASSLFFTVGSEEDFRYYLPRILEILTTEPAWWPDPEVAGRKLVLAQWSKWTAAEKQAIVRLFEVQFDLLIDAADGFALDSWLCGLAHAEVPLQPFLAKLAANPAATLAVYDRNANELAERRLGNAFWDDGSREGMTQIVEWFYSVEISLLILKTYGVDLNVSGKEGHV